MVLVVGLGNPGDSYTFTRHNIGFRAVDALADFYQADPPRSKFNGELRIAHLDDQKLFFLKPQTYMNLSGESVQKAAQFYKIKPEQIIVVHDEVDLEPGEIRTKTGGGHAGHNGLRNIDACIGKNYHRIRIGVGHPGHKDDVSDYVLSNFSKQDEIWVDEILANIHKTFNDFAIQEGVL